jgi:hypothetical protein
VSRAIRGMLSTPRSSIDALLWVTATVWLVSCLLKSTNGGPARRSLNKRCFTSVICRPPEDYVWLAPGQSMTTSFDLFEWYSLPFAGEFERIGCYQADEPLAAKPAELLSGTYCSERIAFNILPQIKCSRTRTIDRCITKSWLLRRNLPPVGARRAVPLQLVDSYQEIVMHPNQ